MPTAVLQSYTDSFDRRLSHYQIKSKSFSEIPIGYYSVRVAACTLTVLLNNSVGLDEMAAGYSSRV
jgi:hypothetical protein